jgi:hypothetical protein
VKHISSERRKGRRLDRLQTCLKSFPEDLESYFRALVWGRVPGLSTNKTDTACVLFFALRKKTSGCLPYYLLSQDLLGPELDVFAIDPQWHSALSRQNIRDHISLFFAETCGDLLTIGEPSELYPGGLIPSCGVEFPHRTILDFFETEEMKAFLSDHVPVHYHEACFWEKAAMQVDTYMFFAHTRIPGPTEVMDREICGLIEHLWTSILEYAEESKNLVKIDPHKQRWLLTCGQLALEHLREACWCDREQHSLYAASMSVSSLGM